MISAAVVLSGINAHADSMREDNAPPSISGSKGTALKDNVNVRARAHKDSEVIAQLKKGETVDVVERKGTWLRITAPGNTKCYVSSKFLKNGMIEGESINVRCGPGTSFREIGKLPKGTKVEVVSAKTDWTQIKPTSQCTGWVAAELIDVTAPTPTPPETVPVAPLPPPVVATAPIPAPAPVPAAPDAGDEVHVQYVVKDGFLAVIKDAGAPGPYALMTEDVMDRDYIIAYLATTQTNLSRYEGKHVRIYGTERWKRSDRFPVITVERCEMVW
jgi:uncharacterized protein YgiM (DUF1202 family)